MKVDGVSAEAKVVYGPLVFKRGDSKFLCFSAQPCWDLDEFHALCPYPENKAVIFTKEGKQSDPEAPQFKQDLAAYYERRWGFVVMKTLEPSNIEWDTVDKDKPATWANVVPELKKALSVYEWGLLSNLINEANALDADKLEENRKSFFQMRAALTAQTGQSGGPESSKSSELVSGSA